MVILTHGMPSNGNCKPEMLLMQAFLAEGGINSLSFSLGITDTATKSATILRSDRLSMSTFLERMIG